MKAGRAEAQEGAEQSKTWVPGKAGFVVSAKNQGLDFNKNLSWPSVQNGIHILLVPTVTC